MNVLETSLEDPCAIAFKEWAGVCDALAKGEQTLILRKGGIAEEQGEFVPDHRQFWLYPTHVHEAEQGLRSSGSHPASAGTTLLPSTVSISSLALVHSVGFLSRESALDTLEGFHVWKRETVAKRFHYRSPGLWVLGVRIYRRPEPEEVVVTPEQLGCKTWVHLENALSTQGLTPVLDDVEFSHRMDQLQSVLAAGR